MLRKKSARYALVLSLLCLAALASAATWRTAESATAQDAAVFPPISILSTQVPGDIPGGAPNANLTTASIFAWQEFIALNWPALKGIRGYADYSSYFGQGAVNGTVVWHTLPGKVEIYPGVGAPSADQYSVPSYIYNPQAYKTNVGVGGPYQSLLPGAVPACAGQAPVSQPAWINLDEASQIGLDTMFAGGAPATGIPGQQILFLAKANYQEYNYVVPKKWYDRTSVLSPIELTKGYLATNRSSPPAGSTEYVSFPYGTIEIKSAWRQLTPQELAGGRFATTTARYYQPQDPNQTYGGQKGQAQYPCWREATFGLLAMHIIQKTPTAPYFVYATFGQADNLLDQYGHPVEDDDGNIKPGQGQGAPLTPQISSKNATSANPANPTSLQKLSPSQANCTPASRLYYQNAPETPTPQGTVCVNHRMNSIPPEVIAVNQAAHQTISTYLGEVRSPWLHYKLVNVQYKPINKPTPGVDYTGPDAATYYQANIVVETDYNLQKFSGQFQDRLDKPNDKTPTYNLITDFDNNGNPFYNTYVTGLRYNMGGCMGCHGNAQVKSGTDFSFILAGQRVNQPDLAGPGSQQVLAERYRPVFQPSHGQ